MSRPMQKGLTYFPFDVDIFSDKKIKIVKARYGVKGVMLYIYLLCEVYKNGYYLRLDDDYEYIIASELNMSPGEIKQVMRFLLERSLFDNKLFQSDNVVTSPGIQRRFQEAIKTRAKKNPRTIDKFWLLSKEETQSFIKVAHFQNCSENNDDKSENNDDKSENNDTKEKKEKETKQKEIKENENKEKDLSTSLSNSVVKFYMNNINPTASSYEIEKLCSWSSKISDDLMLKGVELAVENNKRRLSYIEGIYRNWTSENLKTLEQYESREKIREEEKNGKFGRGIKANTYTAKDKENGRVFKGISEEQFNSRLNGL